MYVYMQGESILIPASVTGTKSLITGLTVVMKLSKRGEVPPESAAVAATLTVENYTSPEVTDGYLFKLVNNTLAPGIYYVNYEYMIAGQTFKGTPKKITIKESVI
jgi:hypothetical protein